METPALSSVQVESSPFDMFGTEFRGLITDPNDLPKMLEQIENSPTVAVDTETTGLDFMRDMVHGVSFAIDTDGDHEWYVTGPAFTALMPDLRRLASDPKKLWLAHNLKFDWHMLSKYGINFNHYADTMIAQFLCDENMELALKTLAHTRLGYSEEDLPTYKDLEKMVIKDWKTQGRKGKLEDVTIYDIPAHVTGKYSAKDTRLTMELWRKLAYDLHQEGMEEIFWDTEMPFLKVLMQMEQNGVYIDQGMVAEAEVQWEAAANEAIAKWNELSDNVNPDSNPQLAEYLFKKLKLPPQGMTKSGKNVSVDNLVLQRLAPMDQTGSINQLLEYKKYGKLLTTYVGFMKNGPIDGRLHGSYNQTGAKTTRLSSSDPNLQNIPSHGPLGKQIRMMFGAEEGNDLVVIDYSQMELRFIASDSKEPALMKTFAEGGDPHQTTADLAHVERSVGKTLNFGWAYGAGPRAICNTVEKSGAPRPSQEQARDWLNAFDSAYPKLASYKKQVLRRARELGYVPMMGGHKRRLPELSSPYKDIRATAERQCVNARIQGSCSEAMKYVMTQLAPITDWFGGKMLLQVHDELVFELPKSESAEFAPIAQSVMESVGQMFNLGVQIIAEPGVGKSWGEAKGK